MANSKNLSLVTFTTLVLLQLISFSSAQVKGGYWYYDSGLDPSAIDSSLFTHIYCAFATLDSNTNQVTLPSPAFSTFTQTVQQKNPDVTTFLSIGGGLGSTHFSAMASRSSTRKTFIDSSIQVARANDFGGLDLDWEFPSSDTDRTNLGLLLSEWQAAITEESSSSGNPPLLLTAAVAGSDQISLLQYYPAEDMVNYLDWVNLMVYDLFTSDAYNTSTQPPAPLYNPQGQFSGDQGVTSWLQLGLPANKLTIGLPFYGYKWTLVDANNHGLFAPTVSGDGSIVYKQIRDFINNQGAQHVYDPTFVTDYCYSGTTWIGYDDTQSVSTKVTYAKGRGLVGYFAWHIAGDDASWTLSNTASNAWGPEIRRPGLSTEADICFI